MGFGALALLLSLRLLALRRRGGGTATKKIAVYPFGEQMPSNTTLSMDAVTPPAAKAGTPV